MFRHILKKSIPLIFLSVILSCLTSMLSIYILAQIKDHIVVDESTISISFVVQLLMPVFAFFILGSLGQITLARFGAKSICQMREGLLYHVNNSSYFNIERMGKQKILTAFTQDINCLANTFTMLPHIIYNFVLVVFCLGYLFFLSWALFVSLFISLFLIIIIAFFLIKLVVRHFDNLRELQDTLYFNYNIAIEGSKELSTNYARRNHVYKDIINPHIKKMYKQECKAQTYWSLSNNWNLSVVFLALIFMVFLSGKISAVNSYDIISFSILIVFLVSPLNFLSIATQEIGRGMIAYKRLTELEDTFSPRFIGNFQPLIDSRVSSTITIDNLVFRYKDKAGRDFKLGPINLNIFPGKIMFLTGGNGSGKSTFIKVLTGLYPSKSGEVTIGDTIRLSQDSARFSEYFSVIHFDFFPFNFLLDSKGNLIDNCNENFLYWINRLKLDDVIFLKNGLVNTTNLSQGQRKRLAMLAAILEDKPILVLDEWAADQDPDFKQFFYIDLLPELSRLGKIILLITHDYQFFDVADELVEFYDGQIVKNINR
ncbi:cyclic peptide export ABC transporter [Microbulbifer sp. CnH-101-G]|uniref:cyclic peptide export ABC transporter n=1 Tax=Microbulbifer sp. CnH-101-G TaxID=3243393 RepID=UPI0040391165